MKLCPIFNGFALSCLSIHQKIFWGGSLGCKNMLNFTYLTMKFHNLHHASILYLGLEPQSKSNKILPLYNLWFIALVQNFYSYPFQYPFLWFELCATMQNHIHPFLSYLVNFIFKARIELALFKTSLCLVSLLLTYL